MTKKEKKERMSAVQILKSVREEAMKRSGGASSQTSRSQPMHRVIKAIAPSLEARRREKDAAKPFWLSSTTRAASGSGGEGKRGIGERGGSEDIDRQRQRSSTSSIAHNDNAGHASGSSSALPLGSGIGSSGSVGREELLSRGIALPKLPHRVSKSARRQLDFDSVASSEDEKGGRQRDEKKASTADTPTKEGSSRKESSMSAPMSEKREREGSDGKSKAKAWEKAVMRGVKRTRFDRDKMGVDYASVNQVLGDSYGRAGKKKKEEDEIADLLGDDDITAEEGRTGRRDLKRTPAPGLTTILTALDTYSVKSSRAHPGRSGGEEKLEEESPHMHMRGGEVDGSKTEEDRDRMEALLSFRCAVCKGKAQRYVFSTSKRFDPFSTSFCSTECAKQRAAVGAQLFKHAMFGANDALGTPVAPILP
mmetsp:Transcript_23348/g.59128  ORF Transcript_23348/g.59128 Transcript_23348/m.59128 type:complete len:422 (-) Transcript_23348:91-1356(-)